MSARVRSLSAAAGLAGVLLLVGAQAASGVAEAQEVPEGTYRFAVKLTMPDITRPDGTHYASACSAALVAPQWIVSAGHCFHDGARNRISGPVRYRVVATLGTAHLDSGHGVDVDVTDVQQSPTGSDVALARLARPVRGVPVLALATRAPVAGGAERLRIAGWGWDGEGTTATPSRVLRTGTFTVSSVTAQTVGVRGHRPQPDTSACVYDSGAPYFTTGRGGPRLVSVESTGPTCPHDQEETTARVDVLRSWVRATVSARHR